MVWFQGFCPLGSKCRRGSTKQLIAAASREECVQGIAHHLNASSYHYLSWSDANAAADDDAFILEHEGDLNEGEEEVPAEEPLEPSNPPGTTSIKGSGRVSSGSGLSRGGSSTVAVARPRSGGEAIGRCAVAVRSRSARSPSRSPRRAPDVVLRVGEVQQVKDALARAIAATEHAARLSRSAATAFDDQGAALTACKRLLDDAISTSRR